MSRIPQHFIAELVARTDIVEVIGRRVPLSGGRDYKACCPFHDEKTPSFTVSPEKQFYHCFGCGAHGTAIGFLMDYDRMSFVEAVEDLAARAGLMCRASARYRAAGRTRTLRLSMRAALYFRAMLNDRGQAPRVPGERGLTTRRSRSSASATRRRAGTPAVNARRRRDRAPEPAAGRPGRRAQPRDDQRTAPTSGHYDRFRDRLMFPIRDTRGRVIAFGGRVLDSCGAEVPELAGNRAVPQGSRALRAVSSARGARDVSRLLVVEGYMDVVRLHQPGIRYAVATLGTATTPEHLKRCSASCGEVVFCFDGDRAGRAAAWRALEMRCQRCQQGRQIRFLFLPDGHDPDSLVRAEGAAAFEARTASAMPLGEYLLGELASRVETGSVDGRAPLVELARPLLRKIPSDVYRELLTTQLAEVVQASASCRAARGTARGRRDPAGHAGGRTRRAAAAASAPTWNSGRGHEPRQPRATGCRAGRALSGCRSRRQRRGNRRVVRGRPARRPVADRAAHADARGYAREYGCAP